MSEAAPDLVEEGPAGALPPLPIDAHRRPILKFVYHRPISLLQGEPGCGKSTRVPLFLILSDARSVLLVVYPTEAAVADAVPLLRAQLTGRAGVEVDDYVAVWAAGGDRPAEARITVTTSAVLVGALAAHPGTIREYTHVIVDDAHCRAMYCDLLLLALKLLQPHVPKLRVVFMSAALDPWLLREYFAIPGKMPVHPALYVGNSPFGVTAIHLDELSASQPSVAEAVRQTLAQHDPNEAILTQPAKGLLLQLTRLVARPGEVVVVYVPTQSDAQTVAGILTDMLVNPDVILASSTDLVPPPGPEAAGRFRVILTWGAAPPRLPHPTTVHCVIDCGLLQTAGKDLEAHYGPRLTWVSRSVAALRAGCMGRLAPGVLFRLYPRSTFEGLRPHPRAELQQVPMTRAVLFTASVLAPLGNVWTMLARCPTPLRARRARFAAELLYRNGALVRGGGRDRLTAVGRLAAVLPFDLRLVRLVLAGHALGCLPLALALASAASHPDPFRQSSVPDAPDDVARAAALAAQYQQRLRADKGRFSEPLTALHLYRQWLQGKPGPMDPVRAKASDSLLTAAIDALLSSPVLPLSPDTQQALHALRRFAAFGGADRPDDVAALLGQPSLAFLYFMLGIAAAPNWLYDDAPPPYPLLQRAEAHGIAPEAAVRLSGLPPGLPLASQLLAQLQRLPCAPRRCVPLPPAGGKAGNTVLLEMGPPQDLGSPEEAAEAGATGCPAGVLLQQLWMEYGGRLPVDPAWAPATAYQWLRGVLPVAAVEVVGQPQWYHPSGVRCPVSLTPRSVLHSWQRRPSELGPSVALALALDGTKKVRASGVTVLPPAVAAAVQLMMATEVRRVRAAVSGGRPVVGEVEVVVGGLRRLLSFAQTPLDEAEWRLMNRLRAGVSAVLGEAGGAEAALRGCVEELVAALQLDGTLQSGLSTSADPSSSSRVAPGTDVTAVTPPLPGVALYARPVQDEDQWNGWQWYRVQSPEEAPEAESSCYLPPLGVGHALRPRPSAERRLAWQRRRYRAVLTRAYTRMRQAVAEVMAAGCGDVPSWAFLRQRDALTCWRQRRLRALMGYRRLRDLLASMPDLVEVAESADDLYGWVGRRPLPPIPGRPVEERPVQPPRLDPIERPPRHLLSLLPCARPAILCQLLRPAAIPRRGSARPVLPEGVIGPVTAKQEAAKEMAEYHIWKLYVQNVLQQAPEGVAIREIAQADGLRGMSARKRRQRLGFRRLPDLLASMPDVATLLYDDVLGWMVFPAYVDEPTARALLEPLRQSQAALLEAVPQPETEPEPLPDSPLGPAYAVFRPPRQEPLDPRPLRDDLRPAITREEFLERFGQPVDRSGWTKEDWDVYNEIRRYTKRRIQMYPNGVNGFGFTRSRGLAGTRESRRQFRRLGFRSVWSLILSMPELVEIRCEGPDMLKWMFHPASPSLPPAVLPLPEQLVRRWAPQPLSRSHRLALSFPPEFQVMAEFPVPHFAVRQPRPELGSHRMVPKLIPEFAVLRAIVQEGLPALERAAGRRLNVPEFANACGLQYEPVANLTGHVLRVRMVTLLQGMPDLVRVEQDPFHRLGHQVFPAAAVPDRPELAVLAPVPEEEPPRRTAGRWAQGWDALELEEQEEERAAYHRWLLRPAYTLEESVDETLPEFETALLESFGPLPAIAHFWNASKVAAYNYFRRLVHRYIQRHPAGVAGRHFLLSPGLSGKKPRRRREQLGFFRPWALLRSMPTVVTMVRSANNRDFMLYPARPVEGTDEWPLLERPPWEWINRPRLRPPARPLPDLPATRWDGPTAPDPNRRFFQMTETAEDLRCAGVQFDAGPRQDASRQTNPIVVESTQPPQLASKSEHIVPVQPATELRPVAEGGVPTPKADQDEDADAGDQAGEPDPLERYSGEPLEDPGEASSSLSVDVAALLEGPWATDYAEIRQSVLRAVARHPEGVALPHLCLDIGLATPQWVEKRRAMGFARMADLFASMPDIVTLVEDPEHTSTLRVFPSERVLPVPFRRHIKSLRKLDKAMQLNPFYVRFREKVRQRIVHVYPNGLPEAAKHPPRPPLAPGEEPVLLSGPEEVEHLYQLYTTTAAERRLFPKDRTALPTDLPTLRSAIRRQIRRFPEGADLGRFCLLGGFTTEAVKDVYRTLGFRTFAAFLQTTPELVDLRLSADRTRYTVHPPAVPDPAPAELYDRFAAVRDEVLCAMETSDPSEPHLTVPLGPEATADGPPPPDLVAGYHALKRVVRDAIAGYPKGLWLPHFSNVSGLKDKRLLELRGTLGYRRWVDLFRTMPDAVEVGFLGWKNGGYLLLPTAKRWQPRGAGGRRPPHDPRVTLYDRFLARMAVHLASPPDAETRARLPFTPRHDPGVAAAYLAVQDLVLATLAEWPEGRDIRKVCWSLRLSDNRIANWRTEAGFRAWNLFFRSMPDVLTVMPDPEDPAVTLLVPHPAAHRWVQPAGLPALQAEEAALRRLVAHFIEHFPQGVDLQDFCVHTGLADRRFVHKWHALGHERLVDWLASMPDVIELRPVPGEDPLRFDVYPAGLVLSNTTAGKPVLLSSATGGLRVFRRTVAALAAGLEALPEGERRKHTVAAQYQALRAVVTAVADRQGQALGLQDFAEAAELENPELVAARRQVGYSQCLNLLRSMPDLVRVQRPRADPDGWEVVPASALLDLAPGPTDWPLGMEAGLKDGVVSLPPFQGGAPTAPAPASTPGTRRGILQLQCQCSCHPHPARRFPSHPTTPMGAHHVPAIHSACVVS